MIRTMSEASTAEYACSTIERTVASMAVAEARLSRLRAYAKQRPDDEMAAALLAYTEFAVGRMRLCRDQVAASLALLGQHSWTD